ncbi:uncharacterized protein [Battus philenor]|uniref:uncharacterized protein n=1 Tax=Battus philenor TaxID=42288 RepID=UPI0035CF8D9A
MWSSWSSPRPALRWALFPQSGGARRALGTIAVIRRTWAGEECRCVGSSRWSRQLVTAARGGHGSSSRQRARAPLYIDSCTGSDAPSYSICVRKCILYGAKLNGKHQQVQCDQLSVSLRVILKTKTHKTKLLEKLHVRNVSGRRRLVKLMVVEAKRLWSGDHDPVDAKWADPTLVGPTTQSRSRVEYRTREPRVAAWEPRASINIFSNKNLLLTHCLIKALHRVFSRARSCYGNIDPCISDILLFAGFHNKPPSSAKPLYASRTCRRRSLRSPSSSMRALLALFACSSLSALIQASYKEQYRVPRDSTKNWETYVFSDKEYLIQNLPVSWENARILCQGHHNGHLAVLDTREKSEFLAEALSESQLEVESVWVGARRDSSEDPEGYRWGRGAELRRTAADILANENDDNAARHYPAWLNRTHVPVPDGGADCVALERVQHDKPVFLDLSCLLERPFVCEREAQVEVAVQELRSVRCRTGLYRVYDGRLDWHQAAAHCVLHKMTLANIGTMRCLRKLGLTMLKSRPSIENAWVGAKGSLGHWTWLDSGLSIFQTTSYTDVQPNLWPPMKDRSTVKQSGCLQLDRHTAKDPVFLEARCERRMQFICYKGVAGMRRAAQIPSDDNFYYVLVRQQYYWQHAFENCLRMNGSLAAPDAPDVLVQLLLLMGENKDEPVEHIWISGRLNMTKDVNSDQVVYAWQNPINGKRIPDTKSDNESLYGTFVPPWLDEEFSMDNPCLNLDRQDHLNGLVYGMSCDTPQYSICMIEKSTSKAVVKEATVDV